ncbi:GntR family transcriptional regulator [Micromonospora sp. NPDC050397]|uniref:GntR family transcriptional regulator n=1 Tax=Micromonospora sp. NPDC050397 TaxID=3364279 RepID=UPI00384F4E8A
MQSETAYRRLRDLIVAGGFAPGEPLTEMRLTETLAMSRTPVREALRRLTSEGLLRAAGRGVVVVRLEPDALVHAYQVRTALEALTAELAAGRQRAGQIAPADLAALRRDAERAEEETSAGRFDQAVLHNRRFHRRIAELSANPVALDLLDHLWDQIVVSTRASLVPPTRGARASSEHDVLLAAIVDGRPQDAAAAAREHVLATQFAAAEAASSEGVAGGLVGQDAHL